MTLCIRPLRFFARRPPTRVSPIETVTLEDLGDGRTKVVNIDTSGAAKIDTHNLRASRAVVDSSGASKVDIDASEQLDVTVSGPSTVTYRGDPVVNKNVSGPGKVEKRASEGA